MSLNKSWKAFLFNVLTLDKINEDLETKMFEIKKQNMPKSLFKYRICNKKSFKSLKENCLYSSNPSEFNDPFDSTFSCFILQSNNVGFDFEDYGKNKLFYYFFKKNYLIKVNDIHFLNFINSENFKKNIKDYVPNEEKIFFKKKNFKDDITSFINSHFFIQCFSEVKDSVLMWGHYANAHKGFCIEYDVNNLIKIENKNKGLYPIFYSHDLPDFNQNLFNFLSNKKVDNFYNLIFLSLVKYNNWEYEKEWRYVEWEDTKKNNNKNLKTKKLKMGKIKAIYLGANIEEVNEHFLMNFAKERDIPVYKMYQDSLTFSLNYYKMYY